MAAGRRPAGVHRPVAGSGILPACTPVRFGGRAREPGTPGSLLLPLPYLTGSVYTCQPVWYHVSRQPTASSVARPPGGRVSANTTPTDKGRAVQAWMSPDLVRELDEAARTLDWSRSQFIVRAIEHYLADMPRVEKTRRPSAASYQYPTPTP